MFIYIGLYRFTHNVQYFYNVWLNDIPVYKFFFVKQKNM